MSQVRIPASIKGEVRIILTQRATGQTLHDDWHSATMTMISEDRVHVVTDKPVGLFGDEWDVPRDCWRVPE